MDNIKGVAAGFWNPQAVTAGNNSEAADKFSDVLKKMKSGDAGSGSSSDGTKVVIERSIVTLADGTQMVVLTQVTTNPDGTTKSKVISRTKVSGNVTSRQSLTAGAPADDLLLTMGSAACSKNELPLMSSAYDLETVPQNK